jgi:hypothetical protein
MIVMNIAATKTTLTATFWLMRDCTELPFPRDPEYPDNEYTQHLAERKTRPARPARQEVTS